MSDSSIFAAILEGVNKKLDSLIEQGNDQKLVNKKLEQKLYDVNKKMEGLNKKVEQKLDDVNKKMEGLNKNVGGLLEHSLRTDIASMFGYSFAQPIQAQDLEDLVSFILEGEHSKPAPMRAVTEACSKLCTALLEDDAVRQIAKHLQIALQALSSSSPHIQCAKSLANADPWFREVVGVSLQVAGSGIVRVSLEVIEKLDVSVLQRFESKVAAHAQAQACISLYSPLLRLVRSLLPLLESSGGAFSLLTLAEGLPISEDAKLQGPLSQQIIGNLQGASLMLLHYRAAPDLHFTTAKQNVKNFRDLSLPSFEFEADVRGSIQVCECLQEKSRA